MDWPTELTPRVVRKYFPTTCASCPLGNLQGNDCYDQFQPTSFGQVEIDLKFWTQSPGKRAYSFCKHHISGTCIDLKSGMPFGATFFFRKKTVWWIRQLHNTFRRAGHSLTLIRADNEFDSAEIRTFCNSENIDLVFSRLYQKDKTHRVERSDRTVQESVVKMITDRSHLDFRFWCFEFYHTLALLNLRPDSTGISPYQHWHGCAFDINKFPIIPFGSIVAAHIPLVTQRALSGRGFPGIVVGFSTKHTRSLRIWNPKTK